MAERDATVNIKYKIDPSSARRAVADTQRVSNEIKFSESRGLGDKRQEVIARAVENQIKGLNDELRQTERLAQQSAQNLKKAGQGFNSIAQLTSAIGVLSGTDIGQSVTNVVALGNAIKSASGLRGGAQALISSLGAISPAGVLAGAAIGALAFGFSKLSEEAEKARKLNSEYAKTLAEVSKASADAIIALSRGNTESVIKQLKTVQDERLSQIIRQQRLTEDLARAEAELATQTELFGTSAGVLTGVLSPLVPEIAGASQRVDDLRAEIEKLGNDTLQSALTQKDLTDQLLAYGFTIEEIEQAIADLDKTTDSAKQGISELTKELLRQTDLNRNRVILEADLLKQSEESLNDRANAIRLETQANLQAIEALRASGDTSEGVTQKIREYEQANEELAKTLTFITSTAIPKAIADARAETAKADALRTRTETIRATEKFNADVERLNEQNNQELLAIEKRRTDELTRIAKRYADDTIKALNRLNDDLLKARTRFNLGEIDAQVKANQAEIDATRKHLDTINDIRQKAQDDELDALNDLDFKRAFETRRGINRQIADAQKTFSREARERQINQDRERQDRLIAYQRAQADARENYQKELQLAKENQQQALAEAKANNARELAEQRNAQAERIRVLQEGYIKEIELARLNSAQRLALQAQTEAQLLAQSQRLLQSFSRPLSNSSQSANTRPATQSASTRPITPQNGGASVTVNISGTGNPRAVAQQIVNLTKPSGGGGLVK